MGEKLPSLGKEELIPKEPPNADYGQADRADIQHRREQERDARGAAKTIAQLVTRPSPCGAGHREGRLTQRARHAAEVVSGRSKERLQRKGCCKCCCPKKQILLRPLLMAVRQWRLMCGAAHLNAEVLRSLIRSHTLFFLRLPYGQYGPVSQLSRSEKSCTGPFNWGEAHCAGENVKRRTGPFQRKSLTNQTKTTTQQRGAARHGNQEPPGQAPRRTGRTKTTNTTKRLHRQILVRLNVQRNALNDALIQ